MDIEENQIIETEEDKQLYKDLYKAIFNDRRNVILSGPGGVGKTFLLRKIVFEAERLQVNLYKTASTGIAALNLNGSTFHRYAGIKKGDGTKEKLYELVKNDFRAMLRIKKTEILIVDEVSMLSKTLFDKMNWVFKKIRENDLPFGGIQVIFTGDFLQLPPVKDFWVFESEDWEDLDFIIFNLTTPKRYPDEDYFAFLLRIRKGSPLPMDIKLLYNRVNAYQDLIKNLKEKPNDITIRPTVIYSKNINVDEYNKSELAKINSKIFVYIASDSIRPHPKRKSTESIKEEDYKFILDEAIPPILEFKVGAQVMLKANIDTEAGFVNGSRGVIVDCRDESVYVKFLNGQILELTQHGWEYDNENIIARRVQIPLILAYANSVHRSQGLTLDYAIIDLGKDIFLAGQAYVALSRVRTKEGLFISCLHPNKIFADEKALKYSEYIERMNENRILANSVEKMGKMMIKIKVIEEEEITQEDEDFVY